MTNFIQLLYLLLIIYHLFEQHQFFHQTGFGAYCLFISSYYVVFYQLFLCDSYLFKIINKYLMSDSSEKKTQQGQKKTVQAADVTNKIADQAIQYTGDLLAGVGKGIYSGVSGIRSGISGFFSSKKTEDKASLVVSTTFGIQKLKYSGHKCLDRQKNNKKIQEFVKDYGQTQQKLDSIKLALTRRINENISNVDIMKVRDMQDYLPWLFSVKLIPPQLQMILFNMHQGIRQVDEYKNTSLVGDDLLYQDNYLAIFQSLKFGRTYLSKALLFYKNQKTNTKLQKLVSAMSLGDYSQGTQFLFQMMKKVKPYGQFLINCLHIQNCGIKTKQNGKQYFYFLKTPNVYFQLLFGRLTIYIKKNNSLILVKQQDFTINFLKQLIRKVIQTKQSAIMRSWNNEMTLDAGILTRRKQLAIKYAN